MDSVNKNSIAWMIEAQAPWDVIQASILNPDIDVNGSTSGKSALTIAAARGRICLVELLLKHPDIDVNYIDQHGMTPLMLAALFGHSGVVKLLLKHPGIDVNAARENGKTALMMANCHPGVVRLLKKHPGIIIIPTVGEAIVTPVLRSVEPVTTRRSKWTLKQT
jgi:hypothetical protein